MYKYCIRIILLKARHLYKVGTLSILVLQRRRQRLREGELLSPGHPAHGWQGQGLHPGLSPLRLFWVCQEGLNLGLQGSLCGMSS